MYIKYKKEYIIYNILYMFKNNIKKIIIPSIIGGIIYNNSNNIKVFLLTKNYYFSKLYFRLKFNPNIQDNDGNTALINSSFYCDNKNVELLLKNGADPNIQNNDGDTALIKSIKPHDSSVIIFELLLKNGADPDIQNNNGDTALIKSSNHSFSENIKYVKLLLKNGANPDIQNNDGDTALILVSTNYYNNCFDNTKEIKKLLLKYNANINITNNQGHTAFMREKWAENESQSFFSDNDFDIYKYNFQIKKENC